MENISKHISYNRSIYSKTALKYKINNVPSEQNLNFMRDTALNIYEPIYAKFGKKVYISSFYRSPELNKKIGGVPNSQHQALRGAAMDLEIFDDTLTNKDLFEWIIDNLEFDQVISEYSVDGIPAWVHVSFNKDHNRKQVVYINSKK